MTMNKTQFLLLSSILKTHLDEVYPNAFIALRITLNCPEIVASADKEFQQTGADQNLQQVSYDR